MAGAISKSRTRKSKPRLSPLEEYKECLNNDDFEGARRVVDTRLNGQMSDLRARALYCSEGCKKIRSLCSYKRYGAAKRLTELFLDFHFDVFWNDYGNHKLNKCERGL